jgi:hypothetical protein
MCMVIGTLHRFLPPHNCSRVLKCSHCARVATHGRGTNISDRRRCPQHQLAGDRRIYNQPPLHICREPGCTNIAYYGAECTKRTPRHYCGQHRRPGNVYALARACREPGCGSIAQWSANGQQLERCTLHRRPGDQRQTRRTCLYPGCIVAMKAHATRCAAHR